MHKDLLVEKGFRREGCSTGRALLLAPAAVLLVLRAAALLDLLVHGLPLAGPRRTGD